MRKDKKLYSLWIGIKQRCYNHKLPTYKYYGGRGIYVFAEWLNNYPFFEQYVSTLPNFDEKKMGRMGITLDRTNVNEGYIPGNLQWVTMEHQSRNRRKKSGAHTKFIGVSFDSSGIRVKRWQSRVTVKGKTYKIGRFKTAEEAAEARDQYIKDHKLESFMLNT